MDYSFLTETVHYKEVRSKKTGSIRVIQFAINDICYREYKYFTSEAYRIVARGRKRCIEPITQEQYEKALEQCKQYLDI